MPWWWSFPVELLLMASGVTASIQVPLDYDREEFPPNVHGAQSIGVQITVGQISVRDMESTFSIDLLLDLNWTDTRLRNLVDDSKVLTYNDLERLFIPNFVTRECLLLNSSIIDSTLIATLDHEGKIALRFIQTFVSSCPSMDFRTYPKDSHACAFTLRLANFDLKQIQLYLHKLEYDLTLQHQNPYIAKVQGRAGQETVLGHNFSAVHLDIQLQRTLESQLLSSYLPISAITVASIGSFYIPPDSGNDRACALITLFLVMVSLSAATTQYTPGGNAVTLIEWYFHYCMVHVFVALLEYLFLLRKIKVAKDDSGVTLKTCAKIDRIFVWIMSINFAVFNLAYWIYFLSL